MITLFNVWLISYELLDSELEQDGFFASGPVRSGRNPAGSFLTSIRQKSGFVRPDELFVRSDRSRTAGPVPTLARLTSIKNLFHN